MNNNRENTKRIARNTLILYVRMLVTMFVGLFTSRVVLDALGPSDFGISNVVGGVVSMFSIVTGSLSVTTSRYLTHALGEGNLIKLKKTFSTSVNIHIFLALFILVISEVVGYWFLNNKLNIPSERLYAANYVLQFSILGFVINLINVPYNSSIVSHERMGIYAYFTFFDVLIKLAIVYILYITKGDRLIVYSLFFFIVNIITQVIYWIYCRKHFEECRYKFYFDKPMLKEMSGFIGWAFWGNAVVILKEQGMTILLNIFMGTLINAAQGIASQVNSVVTRFVSNFMVAVNPQITKYYASGNIEDMNKLIIRSTKYSVFLMLLLMTPLIININSILSLWLIDVPEHTNNFVSIILFYSLVECFTGPLITAILASGRIKIYEIFLTIIYATNFIVMYMLLKFNLGAESVYISIVVFKVFVLISQIYLGNNIFSLSTRKYLYYIFSHVILIIFFAILLIIMLKETGNESLLYIFAKSLISEVLLLIVIFFWGFSSNERAFILNRIRR